MALRRVIYAIVYFFWVCIPAGMGGAPWHRFHPIFKLEGWKVFEIKKGQSR